MLCPYLVRLMLPGLAATVLAIPCMALELHVAPNGDDAQPGTLERPLATITAARDAVREKNAAGLAEDVTVWIHGGIYRIEQPIEFGPDDGGTEQHSVTYAAWQKEKPVICGGRPITGFSVAADGTWVAEIPQAKAGKRRFRELFVDGRRAVRARYPNTGYLRVEKVGEDRRTNFQYTEGDLRAYDDVEQIELVFLHDWSITRTPVESIDEATRILRVPYQVGPPGRWGAMDWFEKHPRYFLENSREFLDTPGEWHLDEQAGVLRYRPRSGETLEKVEVVAPLAEQLLVIQGDEQQKRPVRNLHFDGLVCQHAAWAPPDGIYLGRQACTYYTKSTQTAGKRHEEADPAAVQFDLAERCSFRNGRVAHVGRSGIWLGRGCRGCEVAGSTIADTGGNGIMVGEGQVRTVGADPWWQAAPEQAARGNVVRGNLIETPGRELFGAVGIWVGLAAGTRVAENEVRQTPYTGVSVGWMWWNPRSRPEPRPTPCRGQQIVDNHIHHVMLTLSDGGGIYCLGNQPESVIRGNLIHDVPKNAGRAESNGMFLDQGTGSFVIEENVIYNVPRSPLRFHKGWKNLVRRNVLEVDESVPTVRYNDTKQERITLEDNRIVKTVPPEVLEAAKKRAGPQ